MKQMNTPNPHTQLPENLIVVDREWLQEELKKLIDEHNSTKDEDDKSLCITKYTMLQHVKDYSYPLTPILEDYYSAGATNRLDASYIEFDGSISYYEDTYFKDKQSYLSQPITLKKKQYEQLKFNGRGLGDL